MKIVEATQKFEAWLGKTIDLVPEDVDYKHQQMKADPFLFFRATYYRWCQLWREECPKLSRATETRCVGDLHLENFGTWRDTEGRLIWGVNDFDEAHPMAFTNDLVRLTVSSFLAAELTTSFAMKRTEICKKILDGYRSYLTKGGEPFVLMEKHPLLREMATQDLRQPVDFGRSWRPRRHWSKSSQHQREQLFARLHRTPILSFAWSNLPRGLGSLGRQRFLALGNGKAASLQGRPR